MSEQKEIKEKKEKKSSPIYKYLFWLCLAIFVVSAGLLMKDKIREWQAKKALEELSGMVTAESQNTETESGSEADELEILGIEVPVKNFDWKAMKEINEHIIAWIYIPDTNIDYPILWNPEDDDYYLNHGVDGNPLEAGAIYIQSTVNGTDFTDNQTIIYGHKALDGTMFNQVLNYQNAKFFDEHRYIYIYTPETTLVYDVFFQYVRPNDDHVYYKYGTYDKDGYQEYLDYMYSLSELETNRREGVEVTSDTPMITLYTCMQAGDDIRRCHVNAVLCNPSALDVYK